MGAKGDQAKGRIKEAVGSLTGDEDLEAEGKGDRLVGEGKEKVGDAKEKVGDVVDKAAGTIADVADKAKDALHKD
jgi:uncharacterized protein YjbJ (UPF0337 family)